MIDMSVFVDVWKAYKHLDNGGKAEIRRVRKLNDLRLLESVPMILPDEAIASGHISESWLRVVYMLPFVEHVHAKNGSIYKLGAAMSAADIAGSRIRRCISGRSPIDIESLRKVLRHLHSIQKNSFDMKILGSLLYYWNQENRTRFAEGFYVAESKKKKREEE